MTLAAPVQSTDETNDVDTSPKVLAEFSTYPEMLAAFRIRANELKIARSNETTAAVAGLTPGYLAKLLAPKPVRRIGMDSLGPVLGVLGVKLLMVVDEQAIARLAMLGAKREDMRLKVRNENLVHHIVIQTTGRFLKKIASLGGKARMQKLRSSRRLVSHQKMAIAARWSKRRADQANVASQ
jgi:hypothetical protein